MVDHIRSLGELRDAAERALADEKADHRATLAELLELRDQCGVFEQEVTELARTLVDVRMRVVELERMYAREVSAAASARSELASVRAQLDAMKGNR